MGYEPQLYQYRCSMHPAKRRRTEGVDFHVCEVERVEFGEGVMFAVENMTSGNSILKSMNSPLTICC